MLWVYPMTGFDQQLIAPFYDVTLQGFPLQNHWFFETLMHEWLKYLIIVIAIMLLVLAITSFFIPKLAFLKRQSVWAFSGMLFSTSLISFIKSQSIHACPKNLSMYGGNQPYIELLQSLPIGAHAGHCFPSGHASAGFSLLTFYFILRNSYPKLAKICFCLAIITGMMMGASQMARGEHFMSHNIWTGLIVWFVLVLCYLIYPPSKNNHQINIT